MIPHHDPVPLFVDLDGTLLKTDLLVESAFLLLKTRPWMIFMMLFWLISGKARLKHEIAIRCTLDFEALPLHPEFEAFLHREAMHGRSLYLATASDHRLAEPIAKRLGIFKAVLASDGQRNLKGNQKLEAIVECCQASAFDYAGNAQVDLAIWCKARHIIVVNPDSGVLTSLKQHGLPVQQLFEDRPPLIHTWMRAIRLHQWAKNVLLAVPVLTAHSFKFSSLMQIAAAFVAFGLLASATYLLNDLLDLSADRHHPRKCRRPFAAGNISLVTGIMMMLVLFGCSFALALELERTFLWTLLAYLLLTLSYSFHFKKVVLIDVLLLAALYTIRIVAGANAIEVNVSSWLLAFSMFVFLSLALVKRCTELLALEKLARESMKGRDYHVADYPILSIMGIVSGYLSILVLALYINSPESLVGYQHPKYLWLLCPLMAYWMSRLWLQTARGFMHDDPLIYSLKDRVSWLVFFNMMIIMGVAI